MEMAAYYGAWGITLHARANCSSQFWEWKNQFIFVIIH